MLEILIERFMLTGMMVWPVNPIHRELGVVEGKRRKKSDLHAVMRWHFELLSMDCEDDV